MPIPTVIDDLLAGREPSIVDLESLFDDLLTGTLPDAAIGGLLVALRTVPSTGQRLAGLARVLRRRRRAVRCRVRPLVDTCGTGGDGASTFNISTTVAFVVAACGGAVAKHGNRAVTSKAGSADVIEALGLPLDLAPEESARLVDACGFAFLFAPTHHPAVAHVAQARKALGIRTDFNLLGPLSNPALADYQVLGVFAPDLTEVMATALRELGSKGALVVHCGGLDEVGVHDVTVGHRLHDGVIEPFRLDPTDLGIDRAPLEALRGGDAEENAAILRAVLEGEPGPRSDVVALGTAATLEVAGLVPNLTVGLERAREALRSGAAARVLERVREGARRARAETVS